MSNKVDLNSYIFSKKAIIFDMDGTLLDTEPYHVKAWNHIAPEFGFKPFDCEFMKSVGGIPTVGIVKIIGEKNGINLDPIAVASRKTQVFREIYLKEADIFDDIANYLYKAHDLGIKTALATGSLMREVTILLDKFNLKDKLDAIITSDNLKRPKPNPDIYLLALEKLGKKPDESLVFEDTPIGLQGAKAANIACIHVTDGKIVNGPIEP